MMPPDGIRHESSAKLSLPQGVHQARSLPGWKLGIDVQVKVDSMRLGLQDCQTRPP